MNRDDRPAFGGVDGDGAAGAFEWDFAQDEARVSDRFAEIHGLPVGDARLIAPSRYPDVVYPEDRRTIRTLVERVAAGASLLPAASWRIALPTGEVRWVRAYTARTEARGAVVGTLHDIGDLDAAQVGAGLMLGVVKVMEAWGASTERLSGLLGAVAEPLHASGAVLWTSRQPGGDLGCRQWWVADPEMALPFAASVTDVNLRPGRGVPGLVWRSREVTSLARQMRIDPHVERPGLAEWPGRIVIPVVRHGDPTLALIGLHFEGEPRLTPGMVDALTALGSFLGDFLSRHRDELGYGPLTARELQILQLAADGAIIAAMAHELSLSESTVKTHLEHIHAKLGVTSRQAAVARGLRDGLIV